MAIDTNILLESGTNELEIVEFILNYVDRNGKTVKQSFGINVAKVREIIRMPELTKMPNLPHSVQGIFSLRSNLTPALDLCQYLYGKLNTEPNRKMIIAEFNKIRCGFVVNDVQRIHRISWTQIESPDTLQSFSINNTTIIGLIKLEDRNILMLDVEKIIADIDPTSAIDAKKISVKVDWKPIAVTAEDSPTIRKMITDKLNKSGFEIVSFNDGMEAWEYLDGIAKRIMAGEKAKDLVNVVITDIEMPRMDGYTLTKRIKDNKMLNTIPVVIFSSIVSMDVMHKGRSVGADAQMTKPQIGELLETIRLLIEK